MEEMVDEIVSEVMKEIKHKTKFWSFYWKGALRDKLVRNLEAHLTKRAVDLRESAASQALSQPEFNLVGGADTTPPANH